MNAAGFRLYSHPACLAHDTGEGHPERPARLAAVLDALTARFPDSIPHEAPLASIGQLSRAHAPHYIARVLETQPGADLHWLGDHTIKLGVKYKDVKLVSQDAGNATAQLFYDVEPVIGTNPNPYKAVFAVTTQAFARTDDA